MSTAKFNILRILLGNAAYKFKEQTYHGDREIAAKAELVLDRLSDISKELGPLEDDGAIEVD